MKWLLNQIAEVWLFIFGLLALIAMVLAFSLFRTAAMKPPLSPEDRKEFEDHDV